MDTWSFKQISCLDFVIALLLFLCNIQVSLLPFMGSLFYLRISWRSLLRTLSCIVCLRFSGMPLPSKAVSAFGEVGFTTHPFLSLYCLLIFLPEIQNVTWLYLSRSSAAFPCHSSSLQDTSVMHTVTAVRITTKWVPSFTQFQKC